MIGTNTRWAGAAMLASIVAPLAHAQQPNASPAAFGMAGNYTAAAQGYEAIAWNPAMLSMPDNTFFSLTIAAVGGHTGLDPVTLGDIKSVGGQVIPDATKESWLQRIGNGTQRGAVDGGATALGLSIAALGIQIGASGYGVANLNQDAAEAILFGNAGRTGSARTLQFSGSNGAGDVFTTGALSVSGELPWHFTSAPDEALAFGATGKLILGTAIGRVRDDGSLVTPGNVSVVLPMIYSTSINNGLGGGFDLGLAWRKGATTLGLTVQNVFNTFSWDSSNMRARLGTATFDGTTYRTSFSDTAYEAAPADMRRQIAEERFTPTILFGVARRVTPSLLITGDVHQATGTGIELVPRSHVGLGAEYTGLEFLPLRVGAAKITGGWQAAAGLGIHLWHIYIGVGGSLRDRGRGREEGLLVNAISFM
ncbi:MAG: hypothetical protein JWN53_279 [Gemmatimonadetes bacterium]|jgi:hypothetical protein|nr:hypothetical protein [Gemmatimonadota bacterium]